MLKDDVIPTPISSPALIAGTDIAGPQICQWGCVQNMPTLMNCSSFSEDVVTVKQKALYTH